MSAYFGSTWCKEQRLLPDGRLPPILPIVLYNGEARWAAPLSLNELVGLAEDSPLWKWQPDARYYLIDEGRYADADLAQRDGLMPLLFRLESAVDSGHLLAVTEALSAWFAANPAPEKLRLLFVELLQSALASLAPQMQVPDDLSEARKMLAERAAAWRREAEQVGELRGEKRGEQRGEQRGRQIGEAALLLRQLERRFGVLPAWVSARLMAADTDVLEEWGLRVLEAGSLEEVFT